jgi:hypothetical protein
VKVQTHISILTPDLITWVVGVTFYLLGAACLWNLYVTFTDWLNRPGRRAH